MNTPQVKGLHQKAMVKNVEKPKSLMRGLAVAMIIISAALILFTPWLRVKVGSYGLNLNGFQAIMSYFVIDGNPVYIPLLAKILTALTVVSAIAAAVLQIFDKKLYSAFAALISVFSIIFSGAALGPLNQSLQDASGIKLAITEKAYTLSPLQTWAFLLILVSSILLFVVFSAEVFMEKLFLVSASLSIAMVFLITAYLIMTGLPSMLKIGPLNFLFGTEWLPTRKADPKFGILYMILASIFATGGAILIGVPVGILTAVFLAEIAPDWLRKIVRPAVELLAGIPSVVYGFFAMQLIVPAVQNMFKLSSGATLLSAVIVLAIMILPTIITTAETGLKAVPESYKEASLALGATRTRTIFKVLLPAARAPVLSGVILGVGRAIGETMAIIMVAGGKVQFPTILGSVRPMTIGIVMEMSYAQGLHRDSLFAIGLVLFVFIMLVNYAFTKISKRGEMGSEK